MLFPFDSSLLSPSAHPAPEAFTGLGGPLTIPFNQGWHSHRLLDFHTNTYSGHFLYSFLTTGFELNSAFSSSYFKNAIRLVLLAHYTNEGNEASEIKSTYPESLS